MANLCAVSAVLLPSKLSVKGTVHSSNIWAKSLANGSHFIVLNFPKYARGACNLQISLTSFTYLLKSEHCGRNVRKKLYITQIKLEYIKSFTL